MSDKETVIKTEHLPEQIEKGASYLIMQGNPNSYTHAMFKYPCKFIPEIPRWGIQKYMGDEGVVFDPFSGSGTTLLEANIHGYEAWGTEIDDIAKLIIKVKTRKLDRSRIERIEQEYEHLLHACSNPEPAAFRPGIDNLEHWFSEKTINSLGHLKACLEGIEDEEIADFFRLCFISIIKRVSNADDTSPKPYVSQKIKKIPPEAEREFANVYKRCLLMIKELSEHENLGRSIILDGDALHFTVPAPISLAVTSPPYINAFDYGRTMRLENLWLDRLTEKELREKKKEYVGTEKINKKEEELDLQILERSRLLKEYYEKIYEIDEKRALIVKRFFEDMEQNMRRVYEALEQNGKYMIVIGNSLIRKVNIESWRVLMELGGSLGYRTEEYFNYVIQNPYIRIPRNGKGGKINKDYVLVLSKG